MDKEIEIVGAGPSGLAAAITLASAGYKVTVHEQHPDVGHRFHGDFQGLENWSSEKDILDELSEMGIEQNFPAHPVYGGDLYGPDHKKVEIKCKRPFFYMVRRGSEEGSLDQGLKEQAIKAGVIIKFNNKVERLEGKAIVGTGPKAADVIAVGYLFETDHEDLASVIFDNDLGPEGYAYLLIHKGQGTIATCLYRDFRNEKKYLNRTMEIYKKRYPINMRNEREFGGFGNFFLEKTNERNNKLYVGENAGFQDLLWGFGMRYAMTSGYLAARSIITGISYDRFWKEKLYPKLKTSVSNHYLVIKAGNWGFQFLVDKLRDNKDPIRFLINNHNPSLLKNIAFPLAMRSYQSRLKDKSCSHDNCSCIWCRCGKSESHGRI